MILKRNAVKFKGECENPLRPLVRLRKQQRFQASFARKMANGPVKVIIRQRDQELLAMEHGK